MKKILTTLISTVFSSMAFAGGSLDLRGNYLSTTVENSGTKATTSGISVDRARANFSGKLSASVSGKVQFYFETTIPGLKYAEMSHKLSDELTLTLGKIDDAGYGGFEGLKSTADQYFTSFNWKHGYVLGANLGYKISENQNILFHFMNEGENSSGAGGTANGYGLRWIGGFDNSTLLAAYHTVPGTSLAAATAAGGSSATNAANYITVGYQYKANALITSVDYISKATQTEAIGASATDGASKSMVMMVDYNLGMFVPNFKFESTLNTNVNSSVEFKQTQYSIGTHIIPSPGESFRYHVEYIGKTTNTGVSGAADINTTTLYAGVRLAADFLK